METKTLPVEACELKFDDEEWRVEGYASAFNSIDKVNDTILPGAFVDTLESGRTIKMYYEHSRLLKPGKWAKFEEDKFGLKSIGFLTREHSVAKDVRAELRHGTIEGLSIGFTIPDGGAEVKDDVRVISKIELHEVSFVGNPAEPKAVITAWKSELASLESLSDCEAFLRESGMFSRSMATAFMGHLKTIIQSESDESAEEIKRIRADTAARLESLARRTRLNLYNLRFGGLNHEWQKHSDGPGG